MMPNENGIELTKSIKLNSDFHLAYLNLGTIQKTLGLYDDAIETYKMALNHNVNYILVINPNQFGSQIFPFFW